MQSTSLVIKEVNIKSTKRHHYILSKMDIYFKNPTIPSIVEDVKKQTYIYTGWYKMV